MRIPPAAGPRERTPCHLEAWEVFESLAEIPREPVISHLKLSAAALNGGGGQSPCPAICQERLPALAGAVNSNNDDNIVGFSGVGTSKKP